MQLLCCWFQGHSCPEMGGGGGVEVHVSILRPQHVGCNKFIRNRDLQHHGCLGLLELLFVKELVSFAAFLDPNAKWKLATTWYQQNL